MTHVVINEVGMPLLIGVWLFLAWAISQGRDGARFGFTSFFLLITMGLIVAQAQGGAVYAPADLIAGAAGWLIALAAMVLIFVPASNRYYRRRGSTGDPPGRVTRPDRGRNGRDDRPFLHAEQVLEGRAVTT